MLSEVNASDYVINITDLSNGTIINGTWVEGTWFNGTFYPLVDMNTSSGDMQLCNVWTLVR